MTPHPLFWITVINGRPRVCWRWQPLWFWEM